MDSGHLHYGALSSGFYFDHPEIVPDGVQGDFRFNRNDELASRFASNETEVRAVVEGQMMAKRIHAERMGFVINPDTRILVTGGASVNTVILQIIADVFNAKVYSLVSDPRSHPTQIFFGQLYIFPVCFNLLLLSSRMRTLQPWVEPTEPAI